MTRDDTTPLAHGNAGTKPISTRVFPVTHALLISGCLLFTGCEAQPPVDTSAPKVKKSTPDEDADDILPPQSEPPVVDDNSPDEKSDAGDKPATNE